MRKMDEMELMITHKAIKLAWFYAVTFLFVWTMVEYIKTGRFGWPFILLVSQNIVFLLSQQIFKRRMS